MTKHLANLSVMKVLIIDNELHAPSANGRAAQALVKELGDRDVVVIESISAQDAESIFLTDLSIQCVVLDWELVPGEKS